MTTYTTKPLPERSENDFYPTPTGLVRAVLTRVYEQRPIHRILDPGAGKGVWGVEARRLWPNAYIVGIDPYSDILIDDIHKGYDGWWWGDFTDESANFMSGSFDLVMGNPPYSLAEQFIWQGKRYLRNNSGSRMVYLLRLAFLEGQKRGVGLWKNYCPIQVDICSRRPSFSGNGKTNATAYGIYTWGVESCKSTLDWLEWDYLSDED